LIFDSHAHYDDEAFNEDRTEVLDKIKKAGIARVLNCGSSLEACYNTVELAEKYDFIYGAAGIHPEFPKDAVQNINKIGDLALKSKKIVAIGEIGLDYYYEGYDREFQIKAFKEQMDLARQLDLPVIIHDREAHEDTMNVLKEFKGINGVLHCYSGSLEMAREIIKLGLYIGFTGVITFKNAKKSVEVLQNIPEDRVLVETDCPYMAPVPHRGERNDSSYLLHTLEKIAEIRQLDYEKACYITYKNACNMLKIEE
jgi:TatD DNase family protein